MPGRVDQASSAPQPPRPGRDGAARPTPGVSPHRRGRRRGGAGWPGGGWGVAALSAVAGEPLKLHLKPELGGGWVPIARPSGVLLTSDYCFTFWDLPGGVLAAPELALRGWIGVILLSLSLDVCPCLLLRCSTRCLTLSFGMCQGREREREVLHLGMAWQHLHQPCVAGKVYHSLSPLGSAKAEAHAWLR